MKLSEIRSALERLQMQPTKSLGQNFLHDQNLAAWTVKQLNLQPGERWVEIGPGLGALTRYALQHSEAGMLIEKDDRIIDYLREEFPQLQLVHGDAGAFDTRELFIGGPVKVLGNLPYYISSQILFNFTQEPSPCTTLVFTLQKELAARLTASPGTKDYGALTLLLGRRWRVKYLRSLPPNVFTPVPQVDSAVILMTPRPPGETLPCDGAAFERLVKRGFSQRRKQMRNLLGDEFPDWPELARQLGKSETMRAEELTREEWCALTNLATGGTQGHSPALAQDVHGEIFDVVDETDAVIGQATRHRVHTENLKHRAVHIFVWNRAGELFLQKRSAWKDRHPSQWDSSAAGHLNAGQGYQEAAERELEEELGVTAAVQESASIAACEGTGWEFVRLFDARHEGPFRLPPAEIDTGGWFMPDQITRWIAARPQDFAPGFLECWARRSNSRPFPVP